MQEVLIERYTAAFTNEWNDFVSKAKNGTFLFHRSYMDYHSDRFTDHSLMIRLKGKLWGVFVANEKGERIESHGGLTYGGLILRVEVRLTDVIQMFKALLEYFEALRFKKVIYKCVPAYLQSFAANEDMFIMFALEAIVLRRDTCSVITRGQELPYMHGRSQSINEAHKRNFAITTSKDCTRFWNEVLIPNLEQRYDATPVHTAAEMNLLLTRFPGNVLLYEIDGLAGAVVYVYPDCVHTQYLSTTHDGRQQGALDLLIDYLLKEYSGKKYFSLGTSNNQGGPDLNNGLLAWKEGFGARTFVHDFYEIDPSKFKLLDRYE
jgi:hypothetical protein